MPTAPQSHELIKSIVFELADGTHYDVLARGTIDQFWVDLSDVGHFADVAVFLVESLLDQDLEQSLIVEDVPEATDGHRHRQTLFRKVTVTSSANRDRLGVRNLHFLLLLDELLVAWDVSSVVSHNLLLLL